MQKYCSYTFQFKTLLPFLMLGFVIGMIAVIIPPQDAIGITALCVFFMALLFLICLQKHAELRKILVIAFVLRAILALIHLYVIPLPDSQADAVTFERIGWELAQGWAKGEPFKLITGAYLYSWIIGMVYYVLGRSILVIQAINVFLGTLTVYLTATITRELFNIRIAIFTVWATCLFPSLLLYSAITMREAVTVFFFALALLYLVHWLKVDRIHFLLLSMVCLLASGLFHTGMMFLLVIPMMFWFYRAVIVFLKARMGLFTLKVLASILLIGVLLVPFVTGAGMEKVGDLTRLLDSDYFGMRHGIQARDRAAYLTSLKIASPTDLLFAVPLKVIYFLFAPFPWQISAPVDFVGALDGSLYLGLIVSALYGLMEIRRQRGKTVFWGLVAVLITGIAIFAMGTGNYGTALRHRAKFAFLLIAIAGPILYHLWQRSVGRIRASKNLYYQKVAGVPGGGVNGCK